MAYPQQRRPPPARQYGSSQGAGWQDQVQAGPYDQGFQNYGNGAYQDDGGAHGDSEYGQQGGYANAPGYGSHGSRSRPPPRPGYGAPPQDPSRRGPPPGARRGSERGGYGPGGGRGGPPGRGGPMNRPPPQQRRQPPPMSPDKASWDSPFPTAPSASSGRRKGSEDNGRIARQMAGLDLNGQSPTSQRPPDRPHTSHSTRPDRSRPPNDRSYPSDPIQQGARGYGQSPSGYSDPARRPPGRSYTDMTAPPPLAPKRSATTPISPTTGVPRYPGQNTYQEPAMPEESLYPEMQPPLRPFTAGGTRPVKNFTNPQPSFVQDPATKTYSTYAYHDFFSHYVDPEDNDEGDEPDMPNFDAMPSIETNHHRGTSIDEHLTPSTERPTPSVSSGGYAAYKPPEPVPQTNQFEQAGFQFDLPNDNLASRTSGGSYGAPQQWDNPMQGHGPPQPYRTNQPGGYDDGVNGVGVPSPEQNPDSLPVHPTPFRPGLDQGGSKPAPVRQYNNGPQSGPPPVTQGGPTNEAERPKSGPVTHEELNRLQQMVRDRPMDYKTHMILVKKMVEASIVLIGEEGRVDAKTRIKNREKYINDAYKMVKKMVHAGHPDAMFFLADCYGQGMLGLQVDAKEAFLLYQSAAKAGHAESAYRTAVCCELGQEDGGGTKRDALKAVQWYRRAASLGNTPAMYKMGIILLKGLLGQQKNPRESLTWLKRAAERADEENPHALHELALLYESTNNNDFIVRDEEYSKQLFEQAADLGYKFSQFRLGAAYEYGVMGCIVDPRQSIIWYTRAAAQGEHQSELALSGWYLTGAEGILQQSDTEAYLWARKAAAAGLPKAEYAMGYFTEVGIGVSSNLEDAKRWYWRAASQNFDKARERLEDLKKGGGRMQKTRVSRSAVSKQNEGDCIVM